MGQMISTWRMSEEGLRLGNQILQEKDNLGEAIVRHLLNNSLSDKIVP